MTAADTFKILVSTDNHLGYLEKDGVRGKDSFVTFEEILKIGVAEEVDFILLGGDLFHENKPSISAIHKCTALLRQYTLGNKAVKFEFLSDPNVNFNHNSKFSWVNYEDPNMNVALPVFTIHGNHDDPMGPDAICALDIFSASGLVNFFGKYTSVQKVEISPILLRKGSTRLALYGLGAIRDERLHRMFVHNQITMLRPREDKDDWFSMFVVHQNRAKHGPTNYLPEQFLDEFLDLIIWGHEHDCRIDPEWNAQQNFYVSQPGSSVATSLSEGEAGEKHVGILEIRGREFKMRKVALKTVRPFQMDDVVLEDIDSLKPSDPKLAQKVEQFCRAKIEQLIESAELSGSGHPLQPREPLIRLRVDYSGGFESFSSQRFGQAFVERVANPKDMIQFHRRRERAKRDLEGLGSGGRRKDDSSVNLDVAGGVGRLSASLDSTRVEDLVRQFFSKSGDKQRLGLLTERELGLAVQTFVEKDAKDAIGRVVDVQVERVRRHLETKATVDEEAVLREILRLKAARDALADGDEDAEDEEVAKALREAEDAGGGDDDEEEEELMLSPPTRGRGRGARGGKKAEEEEPARGRGRGGRGRGRGRGKGRGGVVQGTLESAFSQRSRLAVSQLMESDDEAHIDDDSDDGARKKRRTTNQRPKAKTQKRPVISDSDSDGGFAPIRRRKR